MHIDPLTYRPRCTQFLAGQLTKGTLVLFLGAGSSSGACLPSWPKLINGMRQGIGLPAIDFRPDVSAEELQLKADEVKDHFGTDEVGYRQLVKKCLYSGVDLSTAILRDGLLGAVGALIMGSRRGNVRRVMTTNFDSMLEWFVSLYGFVARVVYRQPALEGAEDVRIYHPHGFLPHPELGLPDSDFLILGLDSINKRIGTPGEPWFELTRRLLRTGIGLFVGLSLRSFRDRALAPLFATVGEEIRDWRPTGVWVIVGMEDEGVKKEFLRSNIVPLFCPTTQDVPEFLLEICQQAAKAGILA